MSEPTDQAPGATATATWATTLDGEPITGTVTVTKGTAPPPPVSTLSGLTLDKPSLQVGETGTGTVTRTAPYDQGLTVGLTAVGVTVPFGVTIGPGAGSAPFAYTGALAGAGSIIASVGANTRAASVTVTPRPTPIPTRLNVRDKGIRADGSDETAALQKILDEAPRGMEVYFPAGRYAHSLPLHIRTPGLSVSGDGPLTEIVSGMAQNLWIGGAGLGTQDVLVRTLTLVGAPGKYRAEGNFGHGILSDSAKNTRVSDVLLRSPGNGVYQSGDAVGLACDNVRIQGFGSVGFGLGDGATLTNCQAIQDVALDGSTRPAYGVYVHNGSQNVMIADSRFENAGSYGFHFWAQADGFPTGPISVLRCQFLNNAIGLIVANSPATAGRVQGLTIQDCIFQGVVRGSCVVIRQGDGVLFERNTIRSGKQAVEMIDCQGLALGQWSPDSPGGVIRNAIARNNLIDGWDYGLYALASNGGRFENCVVGPNVITNCRNPVRALGIPGLTLIS